MNARNEERIGTGGDVVGAEGTSCVGVSCSENENTAVPNLALFGLCRSYVVFFVVVRLTFECMPQQARFES